MQSPGAAVAQLTGITSKVWAQTAIDVTLGSNENCTDGREYKFAANSTGALLECRDGKVVETRFSWTSRFDGLDTYIAFRGVEYRLIVSIGSDPQEGVNYEEAVLRVEDVRSVPTTDIVLRRFP